MSDAPKAAEQLGVAIRIGVQVAKAAGATNGDVLNVLVKATGECAAEAAAPGFEVRLAHNLAARILEAKRR